MTKATLSVEQGSAGSAWAAMLAVLAVKGCLAVTRCRLAKDSKQSWPKLPYKWRRVLSVLLTAATIDNLSWCPGCLMPQLYWIHKVECKQQYLLCMGKAAFYNAQRRSVKGRRKIPWEIIEYPWRYKTVVQLSKLSLRILPIRRGIYYWNDNEMPAERIIVIMKNG